MNVLTITFTACTPTPANGYKISYRPIGSAIAYRVATPNATSSPAIVNDSSDADGTQYEGYIESDCGGGMLGVPVPFNTGGGACGAVTSLVVTDVTINSVTVNFGTVPTATSYSIFAVRLSDNVILPAISVTNPPAVYGGLAPNTDYMLYVRTFCSNGGASSYSTIAFTTLP